MNKQEFLERMREGLYGLPPKDIEERLTFYEEMIEDRIEEGLSEEEAVSAVGTVDEIVAQTVAETPLVKIAKERIKSKRRLSAGEIILLALGSPIWLPLGIAAFAVILSLYISLWAMIVSFWAIFAALAGGSLGSLIASVAFVCAKNVPSGIAMLAAAFVLAGLLIFAFYGCMSATKGTLLLTKSAALWAKKRLARKEEA